VEGAFGMAERFCAQLGARNLERGAEDLWWVNLGECSVAGALPVTEGAWDGGAVLADRRTARDDRATEEKEQEKDK
jgi:hypothetical protein